MSSKLCFCMAFSIKLSEAMLSRKQTEGLRCSHDRVADLWMDPDLPGVSHSVTWQSKRQCRVPQLGKSPFWAAFLPNWIGTIQRNPGSHHLFMLEADTAPQKHVQCKKTRSKLWIFCRFSRVLHTNNQLEECWSHVSMDTRTILCAAQSLTGSLREKVACSSHCPPLIFSLGPWIAHFKSTGSLKPIAASFSTTSFTKPFSRDAN